MRNFYILIVVVLNTARGCDGCSDEPKQCNGYVEYPQLMKDYFMFKDSSYWIYQDSISGDIDSFWVTDFKRFDNEWPYYETGTKNTPCYEFIRYDIKRKLYPKLKERVYLNGIYQRNNLENLTSYYNTHELSYLGSNIKNARRITSYRRDSIRSETYYEDGFVIKLTNYKLRNFVFDNVLFLYYPNISSDDWVRKIYYSKNIGVIKFEDEYDKVWELIRYKIKQ